jgi:hypothetical protein
MPSAEAHIDTDRASRYLVQLCKHADAMGRGRHGSRMHPGGSPTHPEVQAEWTDATGRLTFTPWGECTLTADADALRLRIDARDATGLRNIRDVLTKDVQRIGRRDNLILTWLPVAGSWSAGGVGR